MWRFLYYLDGSCFLFPARSSAVSIDRYEPDGQGVVVLIMMSTDRARPLTARRRARAPEPAAALLSVEDAMLRVEQDAEFARRVSIHRITYDPNRWRQCTQQVRLDALGFEIADTDQDQKLDFAEFCALVRRREEGPHTHAELAERFEALDADNSGKVDMNEYLMWCLKDAIHRSAVRVIDLFKQWDEDGSGDVSKREFRRAISALGFDGIADDAAVDAVFDELDFDKSGSIDVGELTRALQGDTWGLRRGDKGEIVTKSTNKHALRKSVGGAQRPRVGALPSVVRLLPTATDSVQQQLRRILRANAVRVIDLFRQWDEDMNGVVSKAEFRKAMATLGYSAPRVEVDALFASFDTDSSGAIEFAELKAALA